MTPFQICGRPEWMEMLDALVAATGSPSRAALIERMAAEEAIRLGIAPVERLTPSKFDKWLRPRERATAG